MLGSGAYEVPAVTEPQTDRELLEATWEAYTEEFADHVGDVVSPYEHVETEDQVDWGVQVFMFGYALGSIAGADVATSTTLGAEIDADRVQNIVATVIEIAEADDVPVSSTSVKRDFGGWQE